MSELPPRDQRPPSDEGDLAGPGPLWEDPPTSTAGGDREAASRATGSEGVAGSELTRGEPASPTVREPDAAGESQPVPLPDPEAGPVSEREQRRIERERERHAHPQGMVPARERRRFAVERVFVRLIATGGIVAIAVALGAILSSQDVAGWTIGLVIGLVTVILAALLWSSREL